MLHDVKSSKQIGGVWGAPMVPIKLHKRSEILRLQLKLLKRNSQGREENGLVQFSLIRKRVGKQGPGQ